VSGPWDWVVFTSPNAVRHSAAALDRSGAGPLAEVLATARVACVGPVTAEEARQSGLAVSVVPAEFTGGALAAALAAAGGLAGARVLWPRGEAAAETVVASLGAEGADVTAPVAYRTLPDAAVARELASAILQGDIDVVTFTSPSAVHSLAAELRAPAEIRVVAIGPVTAVAARAAGYRVDAVAAAHTSAGVADAVRELYG
jgi:uroporphyrinogen-III synthase